MLTEVNIDRHEEIKASYKSPGKGYSNMYDGIITVQGGEGIPVGVQGNENRYRPEAFRDSPEPVIIVFTNPL
ncbi:MAG: hypothetical protein IKY07_00715 [Clostridia bacterium]|nr:hypothetical protein [Clostridia bacterium]MBR5005594.1 hypothetical protein [Clostridia bacterium]